MATSKDFRVKNGLVVEQDISFGGSFKDLSGNLITLGSTSSDTYTVKDALILQQSETPIGTVVSKSSIPSFTSPVTYTGGSPSQLLTALNFGYGYFYSNYANIYSYAGAMNSNAFKDFFAAGKNIIIQKNGYTWDLAINSYNDGVSNATIYYTVTSTNSPWPDPSFYDSYFEQSQPSISIAGTVVTPEQYVLTLNNPTTALDASDKLIFNGSQTGTPYTLNVTSVGTWDINVTSGPISTNNYYVDFGANVYNANQQPIRDLLQVGHTVTISDNVWGGSGVYLVTSVGTDGTWYSTQGMRIVLQYVSGTNYPTTYTDLGNILRNYLTLATGIVTPNYTTEYIDDFAIADGSTYKSFNQYSYLTVGDVISYIPGTTAVQFKDETGNNIKAITYNNSTAEMSYDGIVQAVSIDTTNNRLYSLDSNVNSLAFSNIVTLGYNSRAEGNFAVALGYNARAADSSVALGRDAYASSTYSIAVGYNSGASTFGSAMGYMSYAGSTGVAMGNSVSTNSGVALGGTANGSRAINIGIFSQSNHPSQISISSSTDPNYINQISTFFWSDGNLTKSGLTYLYAINGITGSNQTTTSTSSNYSVDLAQRFNKNQRTLLLGTATIMIKPTSDQNNNDCKIIEMKMVIRTTATNTFVLEPISTNTVFAGTGTLHPNWTTSFELFNNRYLHFKLDKGTDLTVLGVLCKLEFQVLHTA